MSHDSIELKNFRDTIDGIDGELLRLFEKRMETVSEIAEYKKANGIPVLNRQRENELLNAISEKADPKTEHYVRILFNTLLDLSRSSQRRFLRSETSPLRLSVQSAIADTPKLFPERATVACQGVEGAYSELAATRLFKQPSIQYFKTFEGVFSAIENGFCNYGVLPLENSTAGSVNKVYNLMQTQNFYIVRSVRLKIDHNLVAPKGVKHGDIREIVSHEQAFTQCSSFLEALGLGVKLTTCENTAAAAEMVANSQRRDIAAISSHRCVSLYDLDCLEKDIQDRSNNYTRFICISKNLEIYPGADRTSIILTVPHEPGSLYKVLGRFYALGINLGKLESRPVPERDFDFMFYLTLETSVYSDALAELLEDISDFSVEFKYLGSYSEVH
ncbi:MAG: bifunctional chorismate mutase/prephenate dehydratase [Treponema sp.]|jgi:chorismate mutase/prephenate dehydratase|nr:bifunctional chorismate mutase/prephenate dehydratase [Treponema sp.]